MDYSIIKQKAESKILLIRNKEVMIDSDLAEMYNVKTGDFNRKIKNNSARFPNETYMFEISDEEKTELINQYEHLEKLKFSPHKPKVFTEYGVIMASTVLDSEIAIQVCHILVDSFIQLRKTQKNVDELKQEIENLKNALTQQAQEYASHFQVIFREIHTLREHIQNNPIQNSIGFSIKEKDAE